MKAPLSWLRDYADLPPELTGRELAEALVRAGLEVETVEQAGGEVTGPVVVGQVLAFQSEPQKNGKVIRWCRVDVGSEHNPAPAATIPPGRGIVCGAANFAVGDRVVVALPGAVLPGGFAISARKTYGHVSDGMICSAAELGLPSGDGGGIMVLTEEGARLGADATAVLGLRDEVLDIAVTPDRGYCLSLRGLAREAAQSLGVGFHDPVDRPVPAARADGYPVRVESAACAVFTAVSVSGIEPGAPSPRWLARRVQLAGMRSISLAVDLTNYVMLETGHPIHAYDADRLSGPIVVRPARAGEQVRTLDDVVRDCHPDDLLITDDSGPIGLAGVMGGASTELSGRTTEVVIEAASFDAMTIARTSRRHRLSSEASRRFERGVDPAAGYAAAHRVAQLLVELGGGTVHSGETVVGAVPPAPVQTINTALPGEVLGLDIDAATVVRLITEVGAQVVQDGTSLAITPPSWRPDLRDPYDYVEEVGRLIGFDAIEPVVPRAPVGRGLTRSQRARRAVVAGLVTAGAVEVLTLPFASRADLDSMGVPEGDRRRNLFQIVNPLAETSPYLRTSLLPGLFAAVSRNVSRGLEDLALFEVGSVFYASGAHRNAPRPSVSRRPELEVLAAMDDALGDQPRHVAGVLSGHWDGSGWAGEPEPVGWQHAVGLSEIAARTVGVSLSRVPADHAPWHPGRCAELRAPASDVVLGYAGELHPGVVRALGLPQRTSAFEIDLDLLLATAPERGDVTPISAHPVAKEDVALIVDEAVGAAAVEAALRRGAGDLLESVQLFDIYRGVQAGPGRKSLAFALRFRAGDRTLTAAESAAARDAAVAAAVAQLGAVPRTA